MKLLSFILLIVFYYVSASIIDDNTKSPDYSLTIQTKYGPVTGFTQDGADVWHGIPFAKPPTGNYRFRPPVEPDPWDEPINCTTHHLCPQFDLDNIKIIGKEDCLYIDVYRPAGAQGPLPVMFWIYGGGYFSGDNYEFGEYSGIRRVSEYPVVIVNVNYRINAFGFLSLQELLEEDGTTGGYGVQDQRFGLKWVQENVHLFGGDPNQVTIFGESAGAFSVCYHISSPASKGLFRTAIMESGTCDSKEFFVDFKDGDSWSADVASWSGCNRTLLSKDEFLSCIRSNNVEDWMTTILSWIAGSWDQSGNGFRPLLAPIMPWGVVIDGTEEGLMDVPLVNIQNGFGSHVPLIAGMNEDEGSIFIPMMPFIVPGVRFPLSELDLYKTLLHFFDNSSVTVDRILMHYPKSNYSSVSDQGAIILRDYFFGCATRRLHKAQHKNGDSSWNYLFTYEYHNPLEYNVFGDYHASELKYVWDHVLKNNTEQDREMVDTFGDYWTNHAIYKSPNSHSDQLDWPLYDPELDNLMNMRVPNYVEDHYFTDICTFWDKIYPNY